MEKLFSIKVSDSADDEIWHNEAVNKKLTKYEKWFKTTKFKREVVISLPLKFQITIPKIYRSF